MGEWRRSRVAFQDGHMASSASKLKQAPLPLQWSAASKSCRTGAGMARSCSPRRGTPSIRVRPAPLAEAILPGFIRSPGSKARLTASSAGISGPNVAGTNSERNPLPCSPQSRPPYLAVRATTPSVTSRIRPFWAGSFRSMAGRTCSTPASTWPNMP